MTTISQDPRDHWTGPAAVQMGFAGPSFWADAITIQLARLDRGAAALRDRVPHPDTPASSAEPYRSMIRPLQLDAYFLIFALRGLLAVADLYGNKIDRAAAAGALVRFDREAAKHEGRPGRARAFRRLRRRSRPAH